MIKPTFAKATCRSLFYETTCFIKYFNSEKIFLGARLSTPLKSILGNHDRRSDNTFLEVGATIVETTWKWWIIKKKYSNRAEKCKTDKKVFRKSNFQTIRKTSPKSHEFHDADMISTKFCFFNNNFSFEIFFVNLVPRLKSALQSLSFHFCASKKYFIYHYFFIKTKKYKKTWKKHFFIFPIFRPPKNHEQCLTLAHDLINAGSITVFDRFWILYGPKKETKNHYFGKNIFYKKKT